MISKKNIRYEGVLYSINETDSTLALQNVRSFGTEGREKVDSSNYIGPQDAVHPYLLFRGCDIKDLHVHEEKAKAAVYEEVAHTNDAVVNESDPPSRKDAPLVDQTGGAQAGQQERPRKTEEGLVNQHGSSNSKKFRKSNPVHQVGTGASLLSRKARGTVAGGTYTNTES